MYTIPYQYNMASVDLSEANLYSLSASMILLSMPTSPPAHVKKYRMDTKSTLNKKKWEKILERFCLTGF